MEIVGVSPTILGNPQLVMLPTEARLQRALPLVPSALAMAKAFASCDTQGYKGPGIWKKKTWGSQPIGKVDQEKLQLLNQPADEYYHQN